MKMPKNPKTVTIKVNYIFDYTIEDMNLEATANPVEVAVESVRQMFQGVEALPISTSVEVK
jgi:hypothetical protein